MAEFTPPPHGTVCWRVLQTKKLAECKAFYENLLGWKYEQSPFSPVESPEIQVNGQAVGGMLEINEGWGPAWDQIPSSWTTYIAVDDCNSVQERIKENGGTIITPPFDIPNLGRMCMATDSAGAFFTVIEFVKS